MIFLDFRKQKKCNLCIYFHTFNENVLWFSKQLKAYWVFFIFSLLLMKFSHFTLSTPTSSSLLNLLTFSVQAIDDSPGGADVFSLNHQHHFGLLHLVTESFHKSQ